jgi:hypothetical protein
MRFLSLLFGLAIVAWLVYTYLDSGRTINADGDKTMKQQSIQRAQDTADELQRSLEKNQQQMDKLE